MSNIKGKFNFYWILLLAILLSGVFAIWRLQQINAIYQVQNRYDNLALEVIRGIRESLSGVRIQIARIGTAEDKDTLSRTKQGFLAFDKDFSSNYDLVKKASIEPEPKRRLSDSERKYYEVTLSLIDAAQGHIDLKTELSNLESGLKSSSAILKKALFDNGLDNIANDVSRLTSLELNYLSGGGKKPQSVNRELIDRWLKRVGLRLQYNQGLKQNKKTSQQLYGFLSRHSDIWSQSLITEDRINQSKEELNDKLRNAERDAQNLSLVLTNIQKGLLNSIQKDSLNLNRNQKRIKFLTVFAGIISLAAGISILLLYGVKRSKLKKAGCQSPSIKIEPVGNNVAVNPVQTLELSIGLQKEDIQEVRKIMESVVEELQREKINLLDLTKELYVGNYLYNHSVNVALLAIRVGKGLGLDKNSLISLGISALLHDIGLVKIPKEILDKKERLSPQEYQQIKSHPGLGLNILEDIGAIEEEIKYAVSEHHERYAGQGYPKGLTKDEIHQFAKIIGLVDTYEAITHFRSYREGRFSHEEAINEIRNLDKQSFFDKEILSVFLKEIGSF